MSVLVPPGRGVQAGEGARAVTLVVAPLPEELAALRRHCRDVRRLPLPRAWSGTLAGAPVVLAVTGDGPLNARLSVERLLHHLPEHLPDPLLLARLLVIGVAGALTPDLWVGTLVVAARVRALDASDPTAWLRPDPDLLAAALAGGAREGQLITTDHLADTPAERQRLLAAVSATEDSRSDDQAIPAVIVDTESAALVALAARAGLPWLVLRAISDTADESLPSLLNRARDASGAIRRSRVARALLFRPTHLPALLRMRARVERCAQGLADAAHGLLVTPASRSLS